MQSAGQQFLEKARHRANGGTPWDKAWNQIREENPALYTAMLAEGEGGKARRMALANEAYQPAPLSSAQRACHEFTRKVHEHMDRTGVDYTTAWNQCKVLHCALANEMSVVPPKAIISQDGQTLLSSGKLPETVYQKLGLPLTATPEQIAIFQLAHQSTATPESAAQAVVALCRHAQMNQGIPFAEAMEFFKTHLSDLWKQARNL